MRPEVAFMRLRNEMDLFANLRPAICPPAADALDRAIADTLAQGLRTADIGQGGPAIGTHAIGGAAIVSELARQLAAPRAASRAGPR
ncbi:hypothetical protein ACFSTD_01590 [Novosphingobium colocasiae]